MKHRVKSFKLGHNISYKKSMMANMACSLIEAGEIETTVPRAKEVRRLVERSITLGKNALAAETPEKQLHSRRQAIKKLGNNDIVGYLFEEVAPKYKERNGGYTRIIRTGPRRGDAAEMCILQLVEEEIAPKKKSKPADLAEDSEQNAAAAAEVAEEVASEEPAEESSESETADASDATSSESNG
jgi:large subunit ribosomal protein L17